MRTFRFSASSTEDPAPGTRPDYNSFLSNFCGGAQITIGVASCIVQIVSYVVHASLAVVSHGIWCGIFFIVAGALGIIAGNTKRTKHIVACLILSLLAASIFAVTLMVLAAIGLRNDSGCFHGSLYQGCVAKNAVNRALVALGGLEVIAAISSAVTCSRSLFCPVRTNVVLQKVYTQGPVQYNIPVGDDVVVVTTPSARQTNHISTVYTVQPGI